MMNAASLSRSPRLKRVHDFLRDGRWRSTRDIMLEAHVCAVNSCIAELRAEPNNLVIECRQAVDPATRQRTWLYRMPPADAAASPRRTPTAPGTPVPTGTSGPAPATAPVPAGAGPLFERVAE